MGHKLLVYFSCGVD